MSPPVGEDGGPLSPRARGERSSPRCGVGRGRALPLGAAGVPPWGMVDDTLIICQISDSIDAAPASRRPRRGAAAKTTARPALLQIVGNHEAMGLRRLHAHVDEAVVARTRSRGASFVSPAFSEIVLKGEARLRDAGLKQLERGFRQIGLVLTTLGVYSVPNW